MFRSFGLSYIRNRLKGFVNETFLETFLEALLIMVVALARKLLVALWRYVKDGVIPDGAKMKAA
jgi:hypothetical protein